MAISEFAPPAQIVANGKQWKSYAVNTIPDKVGQHMCIMNARIVSVFILKDKNDRSYY